MIGSIISAGASLLGGLFGNKAQKDANEAMLADKEKDRQLQREFAQSGIQWRVQDAKAAGVHPVYALGGSGASYTPSSISLGAESALGNAFSSAGQDIGRAVNATRTSSQRVDAFTKAAQALTLEKGALENELLKSQIGRLRQTSSPALPSASQNWLVDGQGNSPSVETKPLERTASDPSRTYQEPGAINELGWSRTAAGGFAPVPSKDVKERIEDTFIPDLMWSFRNNVLPNVGFGAKPPFPAPAGKAWQWSYTDQSYHLVDINRHFNGRR